MNSQGTCAKFSLKSLMRQPEFPFPAVGSVILLIITLCLHTFPEASVFSSKQSQLLKPSLQGLILINCS